MTSSHLSPASGATSPHTQKRPASPPSANGTSHSDPHVEAQDPSEEPSKSADGSKTLEKAADGPTQNGNEKPDTNGVASSPTEDAPNGILPSRKRSRFGTRISSRKDSGIRTRGSHDADGKAIEKFKLHEALQRDMLHAAASARDNVHRMDILLGQRAERIHHLQLRGISVNPDEEQQNRRYPTEYPVNPLVNSAAIYGPGYGYYSHTANRPPSLQPGLIYPGRKARIGGRQVPELRIRRSELRKHADQLEDLVPIRLDIEWDKVRLRDSFTWNLHDRLIPINLFAQQLVEDFGLAVDKCHELVQQVASTIQEQIQDFFPQPFIDDGPEDPHLPYEAYKDDELRITIKLNITIGQNTLVDQFEWDMNNAGDSPEIFARQMARDLSLSGEFATAIAHDIREQCQLFTRSLYIIGHPFDGRPVTDQDLVSAMMPSPLSSAFRPYQAAKEYTPYLFELNDVDLERTELVLSREERRQKRSVNRRGGPALPDLKDRRKTIRTLVVSSIIPGAVEALEDTYIFKRPSNTSKGKRGGLRERDEFEESSSSESEEEVPGSPEIPTYLVSGTARTRGIRNANLAAHAAIRGAKGRSNTPDSIALHHHETRPSRRKDYREDSTEDVQATLIVKLKISPTRFRHFLREQRSKARSSTGGLLDSPGRRSLSATPGQGTPRTNNMAPPTSSPSVTARHPPVNTKTPSMLGRVEATVVPPGPDTPTPPPPPWLLKSLDNLRVHYTNDRFEGVMRYTAVNRETDQTVPNPQNANPADLKYYYYPRIKCLDCPGKVYTPGPDIGLSNFEVHLKMKLHRERVEERLRKEGKK